MADDLLGFLSRVPDFVAERVGPNEIETSAVSSLHHERLREHLESYLRAWEENHPGVKTELVE